MTAPLANWAASEEMLRQWARTALPGAAFVYASGSHLPVAIGAVAMALYEAKVVTLVQKRVSIGFQFIAQRLSDQTQARRPIIRPRALASASGDPRKLMQALKLCAMAGEACPDNDELARRSGVPAEAVADAFRALQDEAEIAVNAPTATRPRVVTILSTGASTSRALAKPVTSVPAEARR